MENPVKIVRYSREIKFPSGNIARENEVEVISII